MIRYWILFLTTQSCTQHNHTGYTQQIRGTLSTVGTCGKDLGHTYHDTLLVLFNSFFIWTKDHNGRFYLTLS